MDTTEPQRADVRWTWAEYARLPTSGGTRYEVIDDEVVVTPSPSGRHQEIVGDLLFLLTGFVRQHDLGRVYPGPLDVLFAEGDYVQPDLLFIRKERSHQVTDRGVEGPPDLVVEVASPSTAGRDRGSKLDRYRLYGVGEYWVVDPDARTVEVWRPEEDRAEPLLLEPGETLSWRPTPGGPALEIEVAELF